MSEFYIVSTRHTRRDAPYITFWGPNDAGYRWALSWAGKYSREQVEAHLGYYTPALDLLRITQRRCWGRRGDGVDGYESIDFCLHFAPYGMIAEQMKLSAAFIGSSRIGAGVILGLMM